MVNWMLASLLESPQHVLGELTNIDVVVNSQSGPFIQVATIWRQPADRSFPPWLLQPPSK